MTILMQIFSLRVTLALPLSDPQPTHLLYDLRLVSFNLSSRLTICLQGYNKIVLCLLFEVRASDVSLLRFVSRKEREREFIALKLVIKCRIKNDTSCHVQLRKPVRLYIRAHDSYSGR